jgi:hypothetical protein
MKKSLLMGALALPLLAGLTWGGIERWGHTKAPPAERGYAFHLPITYFGCIKYFVADERELFDGWQIEQPLAVHVSLARTVEFRNTRWDRQAIHVITGCPAIDASYNGVALLGDGISFQGPDMLSLTGTLSASNLGLITTEVTVISSAATAPLR